jgi:hypothetical protein
MTTNIGLPSRFNLDDICIDWIYIDNHCSSTLNSTLNDNDDNDRLYDFGKILLYV